MERLSKLKLSNHLIEEIKLFFKYVYLLAGITLLGILLIVYNSMYMKLDREIVKLSTQNEAKRYVILELKREIASLSSPKRIKNIAEKELNMVPVNYDHIKFVK